jgi:hypothetical protein
MKLSNVSTILFGAALLFSSAALAGESNKGTIQLAGKVVVAGKSINSGKYTVEWNGSGPTVQVTLLQGKQTVATFPARLTEQPAPNLKDAYSTLAEPDGSKSLSAIYPGGKRFVLEFDQNQAAQQSNTHTSQ